MGVTNWDDPPSKTSEISSPEIKKKTEERSSQEEFHVPIIDLKGRNSALLDPI